MDETHKKKLEEIELFLLKIVESTSDLGAGAVSAAYTQSRLDLARQVLKMIKNSTHEEKK
jgi:hypothetical protein